MSMGPQERGLWATGTLRFSVFHLFCSSFNLLWLVLFQSDPPKTLPDIIEAIFGAAHVDGGYEAGQHAVKNVMKPVLDALFRSLTSNSSDLREKARQMMHPKQYVHELGGGILRVKAWREEDFAAKRRNCPVWGNGAWSKCEGEGNNAIGLIESCGLHFIGIEEHSAHIARNRACAIAMEVFERNPELIEKLKSFSHLLKPKEAKDQQEEVIGKSKEA